MSEAKRILDQLTRAFEGEAWHGPSLRELLERVTAEMAAARPLAGAHSIWELVHHVTAWETAVRRRVEGEAVELSTEQDWPPVKDTGEEAWSAAIAALRRANADLRATVSRLAEEDLDKTVAGQKYTVYFLLHGLIQHDLYHAGQIALLKTELEKASQRQP